MKTVTSTIPNTDLYVNRQRQIITILRNYVNRKLAELRKICMSGSQGGESASPQTHTTQGVRYEYFIYVYQFIINMQCEQKARRNAWYGLLKLNAAMSSPRHCSKSGLPTMRALLNNN